MDLQSFLTPWNLGGAVLGLVIGVTIIVSLVVSRRQIGTALAKASVRLFSPIGFFGLVIVAFMVISVLESGEFFNLNITHGALFGLLGYALALGFDLVSVVCMQARLNATRIRDERGSRLNLIGVSICAAVSAFANAAGSLQGYNAADLNHTPMWMQACAPWLGMVFPALIVVLSMTMDHILDHAPSNGIDVDTFRERERKRVDLLQVRLDTERELLKLEAELSTLRRNQEQASGKIQHEWVFWRWLRPAMPPSVAPGMIEERLQEKRDQEVQGVRAALEAHREEFSTTMRTLDAQVRTWATDVDGHLNTLRIQINHLQEQVHTLDRTNRRNAALMPPGVQESRRAQGEQGPPVHRRRRHNLEDQRSAPNHHAPTEGVSEEQGNAADVILAAYRRLGVTTSDNRISREVGYSRKTVARWKKRFLEQGLLPAQPNRDQQQPLPQAETSGGRETEEEPSAQNQGRDDPTALSSER